VELRKMKKDYLLPIGMFVLFTAIAIGFWQWSGHIFFLFNFLYIGSFLTLGMYLSIKKYKYARLVVQLGVGLYMFVFLGILNRENMQLEGFFYYLFLGVFQAALIHYMVAKIAGPFLFGRGWCGYACWTAMVLDFLPYKIPQQPRVRKFEKIRYLLFLISLAFVGGLFLAQVQNLETIMFWSFILGNVIYYIVGIVLAYAMKDNRAFCKYICPITVFLKPASYYSLTRVTVDLDKCITCNKCKKICPMNVDMLDNRRSRLNGTECILCMACVKSCPKNALKM
jgi:ferredoxin-type protein NapH